MVMRNNESNSMRKTDRSSSDQMKRQWKLEDNSGSLLICIKKVYTKNRDLKVKPRSKIKSIQDYQEQTGK